MKKQAVMYLMLSVFAANIFMPAPIMAMQEKHNRSTFQEFKERLASYAKAPTESVRFLYNWGMKKYYYGQPITDKENARARAILTKLGIGAAVIGTIIVGIIGYGMYKKGKQQKSVAELKELKRSLNPLLVAIGNGTPEAKLQLLITQENVNFKGPDGETALMIAALSGRPEIVELLLNMDANKDLKTKEGRTALDIATIMKDYHEQMAKAAKGEYYKQLNLDLVPKFEAIEKMLQ